MLFREEESALVRLSDCIKFGIGNCLDTTNELVELHRKHEEPLRRMRAIAKDILDDEVAVEEAEKKILEVHQNIPEEEARWAVSLQGRLHSECLSVILTCCFALESYINSLGYHLLREVDFLGLVRGGHEATAEVLVDAIERMSTLMKWETIGKLKKGKGFDRSKSPFQDLKILFNYRNDMVHDKAVSYTDEREERRYNKKLPDPVSGFLTIHHVIFAADAYWGMVSEIHDILGTDMKEFHRHYNLKPWFSEGFEQQVREADAVYARAVENGG